jgi:hypothetical protein
MKRELRVTLMVSQRERGYGQLKARLTRGGAAKRPGEVEVPLHITLDDVWFRTRTEPLQVALPDPPAAGAKVDLP